MKPGYKQTEVGVIPEEWEVKKLGEVGESLIGLTYNPLDISDQGILVLRSSNIQNDSLSFDDNVFVNARIPDRIMIQPGDVLICVRNGSRALIGKAVFLDDKAIGMTFGAFMSVYRSKIGILVNYLLQSSILKKQIDEHLGATINQITNKSLNSFQIPLPPLPEQRAIAAALSDVDALLGGLERLITKKRDLKQAAMQQLLTGQTRLPGFDGAWEVKRLGELLEYEQPTKYLVSSTEYDDSFDIPVLTAGKTFILGKTNETHGIFKNLPVIIFDDFTTGTQLVDFPFKAKSSAMKILKPRNKDVNLGIVYELMQMVDFIMTDHKRYWISEFQNIEVGVPSPKEQIAIAAVLSDMDAELVALEQRRTKTRALKQAMMQELLTGRIRLIARGDAENAE